MIDSHAEEMAAMHARARQWFGDKSQEEKLAFLQKIGILDHNKRLSKRYGGDGEWARDEAEIREEAAYAAADAARAQST